MCEEIYLAGLVHDIGKIRVPKEILCYPGKLEGDMLKEMQRHVIYTKEILSSCVSYKVVEIASNHHEKLDGSGYPRGLREIDLKIGEAIKAFRNNTIDIVPGGGGKYGEIKFDSLIKEENTPKVVTLDNF